MKTTAAGAGLALFLVAQPLAAQETESQETKKGPTRAQKADDLADEMEQMRDDYQELLAECWGKGYYCYEDGGQVWHLSDAPNAKSCKTAETLKADYRKAYKKLLKLDRKRVIFEDVPAYIDRD
jgi:hypothetical protein